MPLITPSLPTIAIVGRPNVGKSTLFNRLTRTRHAIVYDQPGVTRDWREGNASMGDLHFRLLDTAGWEEPPYSHLGELAMRQTQLAIKEALMTLFVIDGRIGLTAVDRDCAAFLRKNHIPVICVVNKCESNASFSQAAEAFELGLGDPICISAEHGEGLGGIYEILIKEFPTAHEAMEDASQEEDKSESKVQIAIVGRPNVGKSTLLNAFLEKERVIASPIAGTTRDAIAVDWEYKGREIRFVDTAGLRKRAKIDDPLEKLSCHDSFRAVQYAHVAILVIDVNVPFEQQDIAIAHHVIEEGRNLIIAANKWDTIKDPKETMTLLRARIDSVLSEVPHIPIITVSALKKKKLHVLIDEALRLEAMWNKRIPTASLNSWLHEAEEQHPPPLSVHKRPVRLKYITQMKKRPPTFMLFVNHPEGISLSYKRYLMHSLRDTFDMQGIPIRLQCKKSNNPYEDKEEKKPVKNYFKKKTKPS